MYTVGLDVGSTTIKAVVLDEENNIVYKSYQRHRALIKEKASMMLRAVSDFLPIDKKNVRLAITGSAGMGMAERFAIPFVQEVIATQIAVESYPKTIDAVVELGGEDAKVLFLTGGVEVRMNGSCAGGTGAFIDQMAILLDVSLEELNDLAKKHTRIYPIASRCGVFAKTDIQPLLNQGAAKEDIAASIFHAVVNQTIGGLAQGRDFSGRIMFLGGPLTFMPALQESFVEVLGLDADNAVFPENAQYYVALGAAYYAKREKETDLAELLQRLADAGEEKAYESHLEPLFKDKAEYNEFCARHAKATVTELPLAGYDKPVTIGIDSGSTTVKVAVVGEKGELLYSVYRDNNGMAVEIVKEALAEIYKINPNIKIKACASTGYGEELVKTAFRLDYGVVETVAHLTAAQKFMPEVEFLIDIGGQDIKCFKIKQGAIDSIFLNEACSSGCGSFISTFATSMGYGVEDFANLGLFAEAPVDLGSRCTVFMNSSVKQAQKEGVSIEDISAGLSVSVVKNALYKVIRANSKDDLGKKIVVQGGTFLNDAILRAFEKEVEVEVVRPTISGLMGAYGAALYAKGGSVEKSNVLSAEEVASFRHTSSSRVCQYCGNHCQLAINTFGDERELISGNRCERPLNNGVIVHKEVFNAYQHKLSLIAKCGAKKDAPRGNIALPMGLNMYENWHFWYAFWTNLGFNVVRSPFGSREIYLKGQHTVPSDTICYPAKLMHGHIEYLLAKGETRIFYPCLPYNFDEHISDNHYNCPVVAYYPEVLSANMKTLKDVDFMYDYFGLHNRKYFTKAMREYLTKFGITSKKEVEAAVEAAYSAQDHYRRELMEYGQKAIEYAQKENLPIIVLAGRPYHIDPEINHGIDKMIAEFGAVVISEDCLPLEHEKKRRGVLNQWTYHARLYNAADYVSSHDNMYLVQLVSFGCGLDAVTTDEVRDILERNHQLYTQIKIDEINNLGAVRIRLRSLFAAMERKK